MPAPRSRDREQILGYRLLERLGAGGFGEVWKAEAPGGLLKAVKFVYGQMDGRQANQEVKALERIKEVRHPFILSLERVEIVDGQLIMVSELADKTLLDRFEECRAAGGHGIPRGELLRYLADAAEALDHLTSQFRLQHLDIKPSNLFLLGGHLKVGDFGLVREISLHTGASIGGLSPAYAAPESFTGECSLYSDQYALAIVYQEMLTGTRPFRGRTALQLSEQHVRARPNLTPLADGEREVLGRALSKNPNDRFPTCGEMIRGLLSVEVSEQPGLRSDRSHDVIPGTRLQPQREPEHRRGATPKPEPASQPVGGFEDTSEFHDSACAAPEEALHSCNATKLGLEALALATLKSQFSPVSPGLGRPLGSSAAGESRPDSLPEPTIFVGIGGIAGSTLCAIKGLFETRLEAVDKLPLSWLLLETDRAALQRSQQPDLEGKLRTEETVLLPLYGADHYRSRLKQLLGWLDRHWVFRIPRTRSTKGIRPLGRLALLDSVEEVQTALRQSIQRARALIKDRRELQRLQVIVIASISGGTGGGCLADVGYLIRQTLREEGLERTSLAGVLVAAASVRKEEEELAWANAYVTLLELRHFHDPNCHFPGAKALDLRPTEGGNALFDQVFLTDFGSIVSDE
ncbi:MAG: protein kinase, partial [Planctomycetaceae bacterium]|nr:protein kinase [Planctomycetaceae bacterium]